MVTIDEEEYLAHYGILRRSGRYPWGSGGPENVSVNPYKRNKQFLDYVDVLKQEGYSHAEIAKGMGTTVKQLRAAKTYARNENRLADINQAQKLRDKGVSTSEIGRIMGKNESTIRSLLAPGSKDKTLVLNQTADMLRKAVDEKQWVDVGTGVDAQLGISREKLDAALASLKEEGYEVHPVKIRQLGTGLDTTMNVLSPKGSVQKDAFLNRLNIQQINAFSDDGGRTYLRFQPPVVINPRRVEVNWAEDGGNQADGVLYIRPGVEDISLGQSRYAQVRVAVGQGHYLKGMAVYKDDLPDGVDIVFNTNKSNTGNKLDAMKKVEEGGVNPFGTIVRQIFKRDSEGNVVMKGKDPVVSSAMNLVNEEGDWADWSDSIASQVLSKQSPTLAKTQLDATFDKRKSEFEEISALTNPTVKKKLLAAFADATDSAAVHLQAAALPRQGWHAILPIDKIPEHEIYAPNFHDGERVVLVRYPHGGTFEIPELTVNNKNAEGKKHLGNAADAVGIHHTVAAKLSGADFDGDTVLVIPNGQGKIKISPSLEGLKDFDPMRYKIPDDSPIPKITKDGKQQEMGKISNLITDMTLFNASHEEIAAAVRHSMVVIDSEKHGLNHKQSYIDNGIRNLKEKYQGRSNAGATTIISRAGAETKVPDRKPRTAAKGGPIDPVTGAKVFEPSGKTRKAKDGTRVEKLMSSKKLAETDDAFTLVSDAATPMERLYAEHSNRLKSLANTARLELLATPKLKYSPSAKKVYSKEVASLNAQLAVANRGRPLERQAQVFANARVQAQRDAQPNMDEDTRKKVEFQALAEARLRTGAEKTRIKITEREWDAIQAGAISDHKLTQILTASDLEVVKKHATPKTQTLMTTNMVQRAEAMAASGFSRAQIAKQLGVSVSTLDRGVV